jgi:hypothetical protein
MAHVSQKGVHPFREAVAALLYVRPDVAAESRLAFALGGSKRNVRAGGHTPKEIRK